MIQYDLPMEGYLAHHGIGSSTLKNMMSTPADYKAALERRNTDTKATVLGTAVHTAILEPNAFSDRYALQPKDWGPKNQGEGRKKWDEFKKENEGKIAVGYDDALYLKRVNEACKQNKILKVHRDRGKPEATGFVEYNKRLTLKARADLLTNNMIWDVKTTSESIDNENLFRIVFNHGYHFQAAHHMKVFNGCGANLTGWGWVFVSTKTPAVHIRMVHAPEDLLKWGQKDHQYALDQLDICLENNQWPGYPMDVITLDIPDWARKIHE
jgi:hypothetical protein